MAFNMSKTGKNNTRKEFFNLTLPDKMKLQEMVTDQSKTCKTKNSLVRFHAKTIFKKVTFLRIRGRIQRENFHLVFIYAY